MITVNRLWLNWWIGCASTHLQRCDVALQLVSICTVGCRLSLLLSHMLLDASDLGVDVVQIRLRRLGGVHLALQECHLCHTKKNIISKMKGEEFKICNDTTTFEQRFTFGVQPATYKLKYRRIKSDSTFGLQARGWHKYWPCGSHHHPAEQAHAPGARARCACRQWPSWPGHISRSSSCTQPHPPLGWYHVAYPTGIRFLH